MTRHSNPRQGCGSREQAIIDRLDRIGAALEQIATMQAQLIELRIAELDSGRYQVGGEEQRGFDLRTMDSEPIPDA
jgi:hypothetical protein